MTSPGLEARGDCDRGRWHRTGKSLIDNVDSAPITGDGVLLASLPFPRGEKSRILELGGCRIAVFIDVGLCQGLSRPVPPLLKSAIPCPLANGIGQVQTGARLENGKSSSMAAS